MKISKYFIPINRDIILKNKILSHSIMHKAGMIYKISSGIYSWMPLGVKIIKKIISLINTELNKLGCQEVILPILQFKKLWQTSKRFYNKNINRQIFYLNKRYILPASNEEIMTFIFKKNIYSYKHLKRIVYQNNIEKAFF